MDTLVLDTNKSTKRESLPTVLYHYLYLCAGCRHRHTVRRHLQRRRTMSLAFLLLRVSRNGFMFIKRITPGSRGGAEKNSASSLPDGSSVGDRTLYGQEPCCRRITGGFRRPSLRFSTSRQFPTISDSFIFNGFLIKRHYLSFFCGGAVVLDCFPFLFFSIVDPCRAAIFIRAQTQPESGRKQTVSDDQGTGGTPPPDQPWRQPVASAEHPADALQSCCFGEVWPSYSSVNR